MAVCTTKSTYLLDEGLILAPERYHPGRKLEFDEKIQFNLLSDLVQINSWGTISPKALAKLSKKAYVIDTGDVEEGRIRGDKEPSLTIKSQKKLLRPGDIIISRLRPYLRQVAYVDDMLPNITDKDYLYACSTEFYVLTPKTEESIAFLAPFLLSKFVQEVFSKAVEGGQHPRFNEGVLMSLKIPMSVIQEREFLSLQVIKAISDFRNYEKEVATSINFIDSEFEKAF